MSDTDDIYPETFIDADEAEDEHEADDGQPTSEDDK